MCQCNLVTSAAGLFVSLHLLATLLSTSSAKFIRLRSWRFGIHPIGILSGGRQSIERELWMSNQCECVMCVYSNEHDVRARPLDPVDDCLSVRSWFHNKLRLQTPPNTRDTIAARLARRSMKYVENDYGWWQSVFWLIYEMNVFSVM